MKRPSEDSDIKIIEVKSEIAAGTRGASLGVDALKIASLDFKSKYFTRFDSDEVETVNEVLYDGFDHVNAKFIDGVYTMEERVCNAVFQTMTEDKFPLVLAGDHSTAAGTICGIKKANPNKRLGVIWIDAHADLHTPYTTPSGNMHGMPLAMVAAIDNLERKINVPKTETIEFWEKLKNVGGEGAKIDLQDVVFIAARDLEEPEQYLIEQHNIKNFTSEEIREKEIEQIVEETFERLSGCDIIYVSFDVDSMDSEISVGTGTPVPDGLSVKQARKLNKLLVQNPKVIAWEMVEVNPTLDSENLMAENAFQILESTTAALLDAKH